MSFKNSYSTYDIPDEIYIHIFKFLTPKDLLSVSRATEQFCQFTYDRQILCNLNFSTDVAMTTNDFKKFMCKQRAELVYILNLRNLHNLSSNCFEKTITKCIHLKVLNITNCCVAPKTIKIFCAHLPNLNELYWSVDKPKLQIDNISKDKDCSFKNMEKLYLKLPTLFQSQQYTLFLLQLCPTLKYLHLDFYRPSHHSEPVSFDPKFTVKDYTLKHLDSLIISIDNSNVKFYLKYMGIYKKILTTIFLGKEPESQWKALILPEMDVLIDDTILNNREICQNFSTADTLSICESIIPLVIQEAKTTYQHLDLQNLILTSDLMQDLGKCAGSSLTKLNFNNCTLELDHIEMDFQNLFNYSMNITELNLSRTHLPMDSNICPAISALKKLRRLSLPACAFSRLQKLESETSPLYGLKKRSRVSHLGKTISDPLDNIIDSCPFLQDLEIRGLEHECLAVGPTENDFFTLYKLNYLTSLTLLNLSHMKDLTFLERLMQKQTVKDLRLVGIGSLIRCSSLQSLASSLAFTTSLESLRFDHNKFDLNFDKFWEGLSVCTKLRELCLGTNHIDAIDIDSILTCFRKLPQLHTFHLHSKAKNCYLLNMTLKKEFPHIKDLIIGDKIVSVRPIRFLSAHQSLIPYQNKLCTLGTNIATQP